MPTVVDIAEIPSREATADQDTNHRYTRRWRVYTDDPNVGAGYVVTFPYSGWPDYGDSYIEYLSDGATVNFEDDNSKMVEFRVDQPDPENMQFWVATAEYVGLDDPTAVPAEVDWAPVPYQKSLIVDVNGKPVINSAGDPFEHGITVDRSRFRLTIVKNILYTSWSPATMQPYQESLNATTFLASQFPVGLQPGTCKLTLGAKRMRQSDNQTFYWQRTAIIDIDLNGWVVNVRDAGLRSIQAAGALGFNPPLPIYLAGTPVTTPYPLDGNGHILPTSAAKTPVQLPFAGYPSMDWTVLGLENW